jgi:phosphate transport system substrate-binding protein
MKNTTKASIVATGLLVILGSCGSDAVSAGSTLVGHVPIDGSSTVYPITEAVAEEFRKVHPKVRVEVSFSGTGGGFKKFCAAQTVINNASRVIKGKELQLAKENNIEFVELPVAYDGLTVVINKENAFVDHLTVAELHKIWKPSSTVTNWNMVRDGFPDVPLKLFAPGTDSGTFDYFTKAINGKEQSCRSEGITFSEDDNVLVGGVAGEKGGLAFFGFAYFAENQSRLRAVPIKVGDAAPVVPSLTTINDGTYTPLSRPIFIYVSKAAASKPGVKQFVDFYLESAPYLVEQVGYVKLPSEVYTAVRKRFRDQVTGSVFADPAAAKKTLINLYN